MLFLRHNTSPFDAACQSSEPPESSCSACVRGLGSTQCQAAGRLTTRAALAVYHVTEKGWTKVRGNDVGQLHFEYYPKQEEHPCYVADPI